MTAPSTSDSLILSLALIRESSYPTVASACLLVYDYALTLADEIRFVWSAEWSVGKVLFLLTRYPVFVDVLIATYRNAGRSKRTAVCDHSYTASGWLAIFGMVIAELIMLMRVWAIWSRDRSVGAFLLVVSVLCIVGAAIAFGFSSSATSFFIPNVDPPLFGCYSSRPDGQKVVFIGYIILAAFEGLMMMLILVKGYQNFYRRPSSYLYNIYQDGIMYYSFLLIVSTVNVILLFAAAPELGNLLLMPQRVLHAMLSSRMLLRLREDSFERQTVYTITQAPSDSLFSSEFEDAQVPVSDRWFGDENSRSGITYRDGFIHVP